MKRFRSGGQAALDEVDVADEGRCPVRVAVNFQTIDGDGLEFGKTDVSPFSIFIVAVQDCESEKEVVAVVLCHEPVTPAEEEMKVDHFLLHRDVLGLVQPGYPVKLFTAWRVPHGIFPFEKKRCVLLMSV